MLTGIPKQVYTTHSEVAEALDKSITKIEEAVLKALEDTHRNLLQIFTKRVFTLPEVEPCSEALPRGFQVRPSLPFTLQKTH